MKLESIIQQLRQLLKCTENKKTNPHFQLKLMPAALMLKLLLICLLTNRLLSSLHWVAKIYQIKTMKTYIKRQLKNNFIFAKKNYNNHYFYG